MNAAWRWLIAVLLAICAISTVSMAGRGCAEDRRREEAAERAYYRELGDGDEAMGRLRHRLEEGGR